LQRQYPAAKNLKRAAFLEQERGGRARNDKKSRGKRRVLMPVLLQCVNEKYCIFGLPEA
jgi:hypothetical protein